MTRVRAARLLGAAALAASACALGASPALATFPYGVPDPNSGNFYLTPADPAPNDLGDDFKLASTPDTTSNGGLGNVLINNPPESTVELGGVRGGWVADENRSAPQAFNTTLGRPDVTIAVLDSGIKWNDPGAMENLRRKVRLNRGELPVPLHDLATAISDPGQNDCTTFKNLYDANGDGVVNVDDYACDSRVANVVENDSRRVGPPGVLVPEDLIIAFSDGSDDDGNGFVDDIAGWDFFDNDNDPFDDVQYGHGTGEAQDSNAEANNGGDLGTCPDCMVLPLRVGESFIADDNHFAEAALYATDNNVQVIQEALGTINNSSLARSAVDYAYRHGTTVIASAADEAAQHNNWPSSLPHVIQVNSVRDTPVPSPNKSYLAFNGCTNFNVKVTLAIPSTSCSSNATGNGAGMAGLIYSAAYTAFQKNALDTYADPSSCRLASPNSVSGTQCVVTPNEVRQLMASGKIDTGSGADMFSGDYQADDIDFAGTPATSANEPSCSPVAIPGCTDPNGALQTQVNTNRGASLAPLPPAEFQSYPARRGFDAFYGYGRVNMARASEALLNDPASAGPSPSLIPPDVEIDSPQWYEPVDPSHASLTVSGQVYARGGGPGTNQGGTFTCQVYVAPGHYPNNGLTSDSPPGDFAPVGTGTDACNGSTSHQGPIDGSLASIDPAALKARFPATTQATNFSGNENGGPGQQQTSNGRPNTDPYGFTVRVVATTTQNGATMSGEDQRAAFLHRDQDMVPGFPKAITRSAITQGIPTGDGESSPVLADLDGDNKNELIIAGSDGFVHAIRPDGSELPGWPVRGDPPALHTGERAFTSGEISSNEGGAMLGSLAVADVNHDGIPEVFADDTEGKVYGWRADGSRFFSAEANPNFSGKPLPGHPFENPRYAPAGDQSKLHRTAHALISSPVIADLDGDGVPEIIVAGMDRHLYAWHANGSPVNGFPVLVVDPSKEQSVDPTTNQVTFKPDAHSFMQGAIVDTPAVADLNGDGKPEIVIGTNEEYDAGSNGSGGFYDGGFNASQGSEGNALTQVQNGVNVFKQMCDDMGGGAVCDQIPDVPLNPANGRLYAIHGDGNANQNGPILPGWPAKVGIIDGELLPDVGEGITGYPVVADATCNGTDSGPKIGVLANNGEAYVFDPDGKSCLGQGDNGEGNPNADTALQTDGYANQPDHPMLPAVGSPAFADLTGTGNDISFLAPAAGLGRALDVGFPEYQRVSQDFIGAWDLEAGGTLQPGFPQTMNDLQFLTGPSVADIDGLPGQEIVEGSASKDLQAYDAAGAPVSSAWPKVTTDWTIAAPTIGSFGTLDTASAAHKVVIGVTRSGYISAYSTAAPACSQSDWPRFHHDNANSGDYGRDAVLPGKPTGLGIAGATLSFTSPGDDLMCGTPAKYEIRTSGSPIDESNFSAATPLDNPPAAGSAGSSQTFEIPAGAQRYVAVRAVDDQGNVGRVASVDTAPGVGGGGGNPGGGGSGGNGGGLANGPCASLVRGTSGPDRLHGSNKGDHILGGAGRDRINGRRGADCLSGGSGDDRIIGGPGRDRIRGGPGDDTILIAGAGHDSVKCGRGDDRVILHKGDKASGCEQISRR
jgi:hypothetical protein